MSSWIKEETTIRKYKTFEDSTQIWKSRTNIKKYLVHYVQNTFFVDSRILEFMTKTSNFIWRNIITTIIQI